jgi:hypothetical protein
LLGKGERTDVGVLVEWVPDDETVDLLTDEFNERR